MGFWYKYLNDSEFRIVIAGNI
jgi:hypothetical protein